MLLTGPGCAGSNSSTDGVRFRAVSTFRIRIIFLGCLQFKVELPQERALDGASEPLPEVPVGTLYIS